MLDQPISMVVPEVVGYRLTGSLPPTATSTDLVLTITQVASFLFSLLIIFQNILIQYNFIRPELLDEVRPTSQCDQTFD